jgi:hypothetical protein
VAHIDDGLRHARCDGHGREAAAASVSWQEEGDDGPMDRMSQTCCTGREARWAEKDCLGQMPREEENRLSRGMGLKLVWAANEIENGFCNSVQEVWL